MAQAKLDVKSLNDQDLKDKLQDETVRLKKMSFGHAITPIENPMSIRLLRRDIARLKTELHRRATGK